MTSSSDLESILEEGIFNHAYVLPPTTSVERLAEENIRLNHLARTRLRVLVATTEGIYQIDSDGRCTFMNRGACRMLGYWFGQAIGKKLLELHHCQFDSLGTLAEQLVSEESVEDVLQRTDSVRFPVEFCCHPIWANGIHQGTVIVFRDITERKRIERRLTAQNAVSRTLESTGSIEVLTPLLLQSLGESLECCWGALWRVDEKNDILRLSDAWRSSPSGFEIFEEVCRDTVFSREQDFLGRVWASAEPIWIYGLANDASTHSSTHSSTHWAAAAQAGFRSGFAIPIRLTQGVFGVIEFLTREHVPLDSDLLGILGLVGNSVGQVIERKRSESVRARLAAILETTADFAGIVIDSAGTILSVSRAVERIFGFSPPELIERLLTVLIPEYPHYLQKNGVPSSLDPAVFQPCCIRMPGRHRSGQSVLVEICLGECLENGSRVISGIIRDDTARTVSEETLGRQAENLRRSEEALRHQTRLVTSIITSMADGVIAADENGEILLFNPAAEKLAGNQIPSEFLSAGTRADQGYRPFLPDQRTPYPLNELPLRRAVQGETVSGLELFIRTTRRPDGFWLNQTARPMIDNDGLLRGGVLVCRDVSDQKASREALRRAKDEAEAANRAKSEFLSRMSHELRTPMNAILGFAQLLEAEALTAEQLDGVLRILKASRHLLGLINEVLDISRIEAGSLNLQMELLQPFHVIQSAIEWITSLAAKRQIDVVPPPPSDSHWTINADRQRLTQVFVNLLGNAVKYNREQGQIRVSFEKTQGELLRIKLPIRETGSRLNN